MVSFRPTRHCSCPERISALWRRARLWAASRVAGVTNGPQKPLPGQDPGIPSVTDSIDSPQP